MKKIYSLIALSAVAAGFVGCADNDEVMNDAQPDTTVELVEVCAYTGAATRTTLDADYNVLWSDGDKIMIGGKEFTLSTGEGTTSGTFTGEVPADGEYTVYYPSTYKGTIWPDQTYVGADNISGAPMKASTTVTNGEISALHFKNVGGVLRYTVKGSKTIKSINVKGIGLDITLDCGTGVALTAEGTVFNIALPEGSYRNAKLSFLATDGTMATKTAATFTVTKNKVSLATFKDADLIFMPSANAPVGTTGNFYGREGVVVDLGGDIGKVAIATMNEQMSEEDLFTYSEIVGTSAFYTNGWYVPSAHELELFGKLFADNSQWVTDSESGVNGRVWEINGYKLFLPAAGFGPDTDEAHEAYYNKVGVYASKDKNGTCLYSLNFDQNNVKFADSYSIENDYGYSVRLFRRLESNLPRTVIDYNSTVSTYGMFYGQEAIVVNVGGKLMAMATKNLGAARPSDFGNYYTAAEAETEASAVGNGWRLPTDTELNALKETYSISVDNGKSVWATQNGVLGWQINFDNGSTLFFPKAGYSVSGGSIKYEGEEAMYCAKNTGDGNNGKYLQLIQRAIIMQTTESPSSHKGSVRLIRDLELIASDPVGTIGMINNRMGIVVDLGSTYGKVAIALKDEGASRVGNAGNFYTKEEAIDLQSDGWYLPSKEEFRALVDKYRNNLTIGDEGTGITWHIGDNTLYMPYAGEYNLDHAYAHLSRFSCWTSTDYYYFTVFVPTQAIEIVSATESATKRNVRLFHKLQ